MLSADQYAKFAETDATESGKVSHNRRTQEAYAQRAAVYAQLAIAAAIKETSTK